VKRQLGIHHHSLGIHHQSRKIVPNLLPGAAVLATPSQNEFASLDGERRTATSRVCSDAAP
jgi:hypothetical protein